jgi:hypothetical protein
MEHLRALRWLNFAVGAYTVLIGGIFLVGYALPGLFAFREGVGWGLVFVLVGILVFLLLAGLGILHLLTGYWVSAGRGRIAQTALAVLQLASFPVGTAYSLYALWVVWMNPDSAKKFDRGGYIV